MDNNGKKIKMWHCEENKCHIIDWMISIEKLVEFLEQFEGGTLKNAKFMARLRNCFVSYASIRLGHPPECKS